MKLITSIVGDVALLPHFLQHYSALGIQKFLIGVYRLHECRSKIEPLCRPYDHRLFPITGAFGARRDAVAREMICQRFVSSDEWWAIADLDEFHEYPFRLPEVTKRLTEEGCFYLKSTLLDRITTNGSSPNVLPRQPLWDQFPAAANITGGMMGSKLDKVLLVRGHMGIAGGHHAPRGPRSGAVKAGGVVHHFKWHGDIAAKIAARRADILFRGKRHYRQHDRFLRFWATHHRLPVAGECGFHFPKKPMNWP